MTGYETVVVLFAVVWIINRVMLDRLRRQPAPPQIEVVSHQCLGVVAGVVVLVALVVALFGQPS